MHRDQTSISPVLNEERPLILRRKLRARAEANSRGAADADVHRRRQAVVVILRPLARTLAEAMVRTARQMVHTYWAIPRRAPVPLHVTVKAEQLAIMIEGHAVGVALAARDEFAVLAIGVHAHHKSTRRLASRAEAVAILRARQHQIVRIVFMRRGRQHIVRHIHKIAAQHIEMLLVRIQQDRMRTVVTTAAPPFTQKFHLVESLLRRGGSAAPQRIDLLAIRPVATAIDVQAVKGKEHAHHLTQRDFENLRLRHLPVLQRQSRDRLLPFRPQQQPTLRIFRNRDPRTLRRRVRLAHQLHLKARQRVQHLRRIFRHRRHRLRLRSIRRPIHRLGNDKLFPRRCHDLQLRILPHIPRQLLATQRVLHMQFLRHPGRRIAKQIIARLDRDLVPLHRRRHHRRHIRRITRPPDHIPLSNTRKRERKQGRLQTKTRQNTEGWKFHGWH